MTSSSGAKGVVTSSQVVNVVNFILGRPAAAYRFYLRLVLLSFNQQRRAGGNRKATENSPQRMSHGGRVCVSVCVCAFFFWVGL